jgi:hypothetical protein
LSSHILYLTSQHTKLIDVWCFETLELSKDHCKKMEQKEQVLGEICKCMHHSPWRAPI